MDMTGPPRSTNPVVRAHDTGSLDSSKFRTQAQALTDFDKDNMKTVQNLGLGVHDANYATMQVVAQHTEPVPREAATNLNGPASGPTAVREDSDRRSGLNDRDDEPATAKPRPGMAFQQMSESNSAYTKQDKMRRTEQSPNLQAVEPLHDETK